jgi:hypothetical protein
MKMVAVSLAKRRQLAALGAVMATAAASGPTLAHGQTVASWISPVSGDWAEPLRWSTNPTYPNNGSPSAGDHYAASINASGAPYAVSVSTPITLDSLSIVSADATLRAQAATLTVLGALRVDVGQFVLDGGAVKSATFNGISATSYGGTLDQVRIESDLRLTNGTTTFLNGVTLVNGGTLRSSPYVTGHGGLPWMVFSGAQTIGGAGEVVFDENHNSTVVKANGTLTLGPNVTMRTGAGYGNVSGRFVNDGTISVLSKEGVLEFNGIGSSQKITNNGTAIVGNGGSLAFFNGATNLAAGVLTGGTWIARDGSSISIGSAGFASLVNSANVALSGPGSNVYPVGALSSNVGTFTITDGCHFRSSGRLSNSGRIVIGPGTVLTVSNTFNNTGIVDLSGGLVVEYEGSSPLHALAGQIGRHDQFESGSIRDARHRVRRAVGTGNQLFHGSRLRLRQRGSDAIHLRRRYQPRRQGRCERLGLPRYALANLRRLVRRRFQLRRLR